MGNDGLALLVVLGLGGLVLWYLTKTPATAPLTTQGQPPCNVSYSGVSLSCGAIEKGLNLLEKGAGLLNPLRGLGSTVVCRASNKKDVFPNDMAECRKLGITNCNQCGQLYNLTTRQWPWTAQLNVQAGLAPNTPAGATTPSGWRRDPNQSETQVSAKPLTPIGKPAGYR